MNAKGSQKRIVNTLYFHPAVLYIVREASISPNYILSIPVSKDGSVDIVTPSANVSVSSYGQHAIGLLTESSSSSTSHSTATSLAVGSSSELRGVCVVCVVCVCVCMCVCVVRMYVRLFQSIGDVIAKEATNQTNKYVNMYTYMMGGREGGRGRREGGRRKLSSPAEAITIIWMGQKGCGIRNTHAHVCRPRQVECALNRTAKLISVRRRNMSRLTRTEIRLTQRLFEH